MFLSAENSKILSDKYPEQEFEFYYWNTSISGLRIKPKDWDYEYYGLWDAKKVCPAIPDDWESKFMASQKKKESIVSAYKKPKENLTPSQILKEDFEDVSDEAIMMGAEDFSKEDFLPMEVCFNLRLLRYGSRELTGWAYYERIMKPTEFTKKGKASTLVILRPLVSKDAIDNTIFSWKQLTLAYSKVSYPELNNNAISQYRASKMNSSDLKAIITKCMNGKDYFESVKLKTLTQDGIPREILVFFTSKSRSKVFKIRDSLAETPMKIRIEMYTEVIDEKNVLIQEKIDDILEAIDEMSGYTPSEPTDTEVNIKKNNYPEIKF